MKKIKFILSVILTLCILQSYGITIAYAVDTAVTETIEITEKVYSRATFDQHFADDTIIVVMKKSISSEFKNYTASDFNEVPLKSVINTRPQTEKLVKEKTELVSTLSKQRSLSESDLEQLRKYNKIKDESYTQVLALELEEKGKENVLAAIKALENRDDIFYAGPAYYMELCSTRLLPALLPNDTDYTEQWNMPNISAPRAWGITTGSSSVKVGIIDSGIDGDHPDLVNNIDTTLSKNFLVANGTSAQALVDTKGHGTYVAGIIGAQGNNNTGVAGVCWDVSLVSLKVTNTGTIDVLDVFEAIDYAEYYDIPILNMSFSTNEADSNYDPESYYALETVIDGYSGLVVCSAGNYYVEIDGERIYDNDLLNVYPANFDSSNLITVASSTSNNTRDISSRFGKTTVDLFAPGEYVYTTNNVGGYSNFVATSAATPHVTGVAALMLSVNPNLTPIQIKSMIMNGVTEVDALSDLCVTGGKLNAYNAVLAASLSANN